MNYQIYINGSATKGVYDTFEEAKNVANQFMDNGESPDLEIKASDNLNPVVKWKYDYQITQWVEQ